MNNVYCDKPGHGAYPLRACEKDGKIFVDMDSCTECGPQKMEEEEVYQSFLDRLRILYCTVPYFGFKAKQPGQGIVKTPYCTVPYFGFKAKLIFPEFPFLENQESVH